MFLKVTSILGIFYRIYRSSKNWELLPENISKPCILFLICAKFKQPESWREYVYLKSAVSYAKAIFNKTNYQVSVKKRKEKGYHMPLNSNQIVRGKAKLIA